MKGKISLVFLVGFIAVAGMGLSYSCVTDNLETNGIPNCYFDVAFVDNVYARDNEEMKDIGTVYAELTDGFNGLYNGIYVEIDHAYPSYEVFIDFTVQNTDDHPIDVNGITVTNYDTNAMSTSLSGDLAVTSSIAPLQKVDGTVNIIVLNEAKMSWEYDFEIGLGFSGECPCPDPKILNGGFEQPIVTASEGWDIFDSGTSGLGWTVKWYGGSTSYQGQTRPEPAHLELHRGVNDWSPYEGQQHAELDTDWDGPGGGLNNEPASVNISQYIVTCPGETYTLEFAWSPRPGHSDNALEVYWDNSKIFETGIIDGSSYSNTVWTLETIPGLSVTGFSTLLEFRETGTPDSLGMFLDAVDVQLE